MAVADPTLERQLGRPLDATQPAFRRVLAVKWWAGLGAAVILAQAAVPIAWIASKWFHHVSSGPTPVPEYMKAAMIAWPVILPVSGLAILYVVVISGRLAPVAICFVAMALFDVVFEGLVFMPLGAWEYPGGHVALFATTYHKYPLNEALTTGLLFTAFASIRYFVDDRGHKLAERGAESLRTTPGRAWAIRALAVTGLANLVMALRYNLPNFVVGLHGTNWPRDIQKRSYLTYTCGPLPGRACPPTAIKPQGRGPNGH